MNNRKIQDKGFSLIEVIISIAVLSILCVIFLQLFIKAQSISDQSYALDESVRITGSYIEEIKGTASLPQIKELPSFSWMEYSDTNGKLNFDGGFTKDFTPSAHVTDGAYKISITLSPYEEDASSMLSEGSKSVHLYEVTAEITDELESHKSIYSTKALILIEGE